MRLIRWARRNPKYATIAGAVLIGVLFFPLNYALLVFDVITEQQYSAANEAMLALVKWMALIL